MVVGNEGKAMGKNVLDDAGEGDFFMVRHAFLLRAPNRGRSSVMATGRRGFKPRRRARK
jgi:hypothetical protein